MKRFLIKTIFFLLPVGVLIGYVLIYYVSDRGDLGRMGYLQMDYDYSTTFGDEYNQKHDVIQIGSQKNSRQKWKFFTIGDSFFQQGKIGIINKLSKKNPENVLNFTRDHLIGGDPITTLRGLINSDYFDSVHVEFIILESVERYVVQRGLNHNKEEQYSYSDVRQSIENLKTGIAREQKEKKKQPYPTDRFVKFPLNNLMYHLNPTGANKVVYKEPLTKSLFSTRDKDLLFFHEDVDCMEYNNNMDNVKILNNILNEMYLLLKEKGITLIVLICPDKFDLYYPYLVNKSSYPKPLFFSHFNSLEKRYMYIDIQSMLRTQLKNNVKDIYLYDDTHWSPWATEIIAEEIMSITK